MNLFAVGIFVVHIVFIGLGTFFLLRKFSAQRKKLLSLTEEISALRIRQHEFDNHIQVISALPYACSTFEELSQRLKKYSSKLDLSPGRFLNQLSLNRPVVSVFVGSKLSLAESLGFWVVLEASDVNIASKVKDNELVEVLGTLLDNAMEARSDKKILRLALYESDNQVVLELANSHEAVNTDVINKFFDSGFSTKSKDKPRGYGLANAKAIVDRHGTIAVSNKIIDNQNYISFCVKLPKA